MIVTRAMSVGRVFALTLAVLGWAGYSAPAQAQATKAKTKDAPKAAEPAKGAVDLNSASLEELQTLPGVGPTYARKIIDSRPHKTLADLASAGVPASTIDKLKGLAEVKPLPAPVDVNADSLEKLQTLPGVGAAIAREIVAARPHTGYDSIGKLKGIGTEKLDALKGRLKFGTVAVAKVETPKAEVKKVAPAPKAEMTPKTASTKTAEPVEKPAAKKAVEKAEEKKAETKPKVAPGTKININTAAKEVLDELPGIGPVKAQAILDYRAKTKFETIEDIMKVDGIKEGVFAKIKDMISVK